MRHVARRPRRASHFGASNGAGGNIGQGRGQLTFERIDAPVAALLNVLAIVALIALWLTPAALFYVALGLVPIAFACLVVISWPH